MPKLPPSNPTSLNPSINALGQRIKLLQALLGLIVELPPDWEGEPDSDSKSTSSRMPLLPCDTYKKLVTSWRKGMKWSEGLDCALSVMLSSVVSTKSPGDQLWVKIIGPASCGKTTLAEGVATSKRFVRAIDTFKGFTSGFVMSNGETPDLVSELNGMTFIIMDADTLLQSPNLGNILGDGRRLYDGTLCSNFKTGVGKDIEGHRMTWIMCGTASIRQIDSSELGERFLDCVVMDGIDDDFEDNVLSRIIDRVDTNMGIESDGSPENRYAPELMEPMCLTGGYVEYLRTNAQRLFLEVVMTAEAKHRITRLGKFTAHMRARPSKVQDEKAEREFAGRLVSTLGRLAKCMAVVLNRPTVDDVVLKRIKKVALDSSRGQTLQILELLMDFESYPSGLEANSVSALLHMQVEKVNKLLRFLCQIHVIEAFKLMAENGTISNQKRYRPTERMAKLYRAAMGDK